MAGDVLELVEAMNAVTQMRLGALSGKHHLRVLRELDDALKRFDALRVRLNSQSTPVLAELLDVLDAALQRRDLERAEGLRDAALRVSKLCQDDALGMRLDVSLAHFEFLRRNQAASLEHQRRVLGRRLIHGRPYSAEESLSAHNFVRILDSQGQRRAAWRIARAVLALADAPLPQLQAVEAALAIDFGEVARAVDVLRAAATTVPTTYRPNVSMEMARALLASGAASLADVVGFGPSSPAKISRMLMFAGFVEDASELDALTSGLSGWPEKLFPESMTTMHVLCLQRCHAGDHKAVADFRKAHAKSAVAPVIGFYYHAILSQLLRLAGDRKEAIEELRRADAALRGIAEPYHPYFERRALHARNTLALLGENEKAADLRALYSAEAAWVADWLARGYGCLRGLRDAGVSGS
jgi:hypothetical protein